MIYFIEDSLQTIFEDFIKKAKVDSGNGHGYYQFKARKNINYDCNDADKIDFLRDLNDNNTTKLEFGFVPDREFAKKKGAV